LIADAKLYTEANAPNLAHLPFITRIPETLTVTPQVIEQAWAWVSGSPWMQRSNTSGLSCAITVWRNGGWSSRHRTPGSGRHIHSPKPRRKRLRRSRSSFFISRPNGFRRRRTHGQPWRRSRRLALSSDGAGVADTAYPVCPQRAADHTDASQSDRVATPCQCDA